MEFTFDKMPWEEELDSLHTGDTIAVTRLLTLLESEEEAAVEEVFSLLDDRGIALDISDLPAVSLSGPAALRLKQEAQFDSAEKVLQGLDDHDPLRLYLQELSEIPAAGDPQILAERYLSGEHHLAEQLVNLCLSTVVELAMTYTGHGVLLLDLIQEGSLGLWQSILRYNGGDFLTHARWWICQYMAKSVFLQARNSGVGQKLREDMADYLDADQRLLMELGRNPTVEEIAEALHISAEECMALEKMVSNARNMNQVKQETEESEPTPEDEQAVEDTAYFQMRQRITELLSALPAEDAKLLTLRFGLEGGKPMSPVETGNALGLTPEQVVRREGEALSKLRNL